MVKKADPEHTKKVNQTYQIATAKLRDLHPDEFNKLRVQAAQELGFTWSPKLTPEKKAEEDLAVLFERFPHLADRYQPVPEPDDDDTPPDPRTEPDPQT